MSSHTNGPRSIRNILLLLLAPELSEPLSHFFKALLLHTVSVCARACVCVHFQAEDFFHKEVERRQSAVAAGHYVTKLT